DPNLFVELPPNGNTEIWTEPVFGTQFLPILPHKAFENGLYNSDVELIAGATKDEGYLLSRGLIPEMRSQLTEQLFRKAVGVLSDKYRNIDVDKVCDHYLNGVHKTNSSQLKAALSALYGDLVFTCPTYRFAKAYAKSGQRVYSYRFNFHTRLWVDYYGCPQWAVCHASDGDFIFGKILRKPHLFTETDYDFSIDVIKMWTNFAKTGKPHDVWPQMADNSVIRVKDLNPNDMSLILENPHESTCDGIWIVFLLLKVRPVEQRTSDEFPLGLHQKEQVFKTTFGARRERRAKAGRHRRLSAATRGVGRRPIQTSLQSFRRHSYGLQCRLIDLALPELFPLLAPHLFGPLFDGSVVEIVGFRSTFGAFNENLALLYFMSAFLDSVQLLKERRLTPHVLHHLVVAVTLHPFQSVLRKRTQLLDQCLEPRLNRVRHQ
ncbi:unnamed protein product, partial [Medioppia subpectinata]